MTVDYSLVMPAGFSIVLIVWAALCGAQDAWQLRVSNVLTLGMLVMALCALPVTGHSLTGAGWLSALGGLLVAALLTIPGYALGQLGAADAKMLMAFGLASSLPDLLEAFVVAAPLAAGIMLLMRYLMQYPLMVRLGSQGVLANFAPRPGKSFPFATCLAVGVLASQCLQMRF